MALGGLRHKGILFGCDHWAKVVDETLPYKKKGMEMIRYLILPTDELKEAYPRIFSNPNALPVQTPEGRCKWMEYPAYWVEDENPSRRNAIVRVLCTFDGRPTNHTKREERLTRELEYYQKANDLLEQASIVEAEERGALLTEKIKQAEQFAELRDKFKIETKGVKDDEGSTDK